MNSANGTSSRVSLALPLQMFAGLVLGLLLALLWPKAAASLQPIGTARSPTASWRRAAHR